MIGGGPCEAQLADAERDLRLTIDTIPVFAAILDHTINSASFFGSANLMATLLPGLSDFIWSVRQINYCLAAIGATRTVRRRSV
ncbi:hypothetical protein AB395_00006873 (plasmid) [Sinorhizobium fredii CCBAU 45436]|nr:hypothetical protein AB395_00006873 [Sinorhizobium fredii CCBAU 45436]